MRPSVAAVFGLLAGLGMTGPVQQKPRAEAVTAQIGLIKEQLPELKGAFAALQTPSAPVSTPEPLPEPSLTEPFEIGEALYDQSRMANAVVSLLSLMQIPVVPDAGAKGPVTSKGITLSESEVHALINHSIDDLVDSGDDMDRLPHTFADLHNGIADLLPGVSVERLAEMYSRAYEARPEDLIAKAMMGRPIEPEMTITRAQIWFLLLDGFAGAAAANGRWGTADRQIPDLKSPNPQWSAEEFREVLARLPLVTAGRFVTITAPDIISTGASAGAPAHVTARVNVTAEPLVSRVTGRTLIAPRAGSLSGQQVTWHVHEESLLHEVGTIVSPVDDPTPIGADGVARFTFQPGVDPAMGAGHLVDDWETVEAKFETRGLVSSAFAVPAPIAGLSIGASRTRASVHLRWRSDARLVLAVFNVYTGINFEIPGLGGGTRDGVDRVYSILDKRADGSYVGRGRAFVSSSQTLRGPASRCAKASITMEQTIRVKAERQTGFGPTHVLDDFQWADSQLNPAGTMATTPPTGGYYRLIFYPKTAPPYGRQCISIIPAGRDRRGWGSEWFVPFNDAQWTTSGQGYGIALRASGPTTYYDMSSVDPLSLPLPELRQAFQLTGRSLWFVAVTTSFDELDRIMQGK